MPLVDEVRKYDIATLGQFANIILDTGTDPVPIVFAAPQRAFSRVAQIYGVPPATPDGDKRVPLPAMSITRIDMNFNPDLYNGSNRRIVSFVDFPASPDRPREVNMLRRPPHPVSIIYQLTVWSRNKRLLNQIQKQIHLIFIHQLSYITVDLEDYGNKIFSLRFDNELDENQREPGDDFTIYRRSYNMTLSAVLLPNSPSVEKTTLQAELEFYDDTPVPPELLETIFIDLTEG